MAAQPGRADHQQTEKGDRLLEGLRAGDHGVFKELYTLYSRQFYLYAFQQTQDSDIAKDHLNEAFASLFENREKYVSMLHVRNSLYKTLRNLALTHLRNKKNRASKHSAAPKEEIQEPIVAEIIQNEFVRQLHELVATLPEKQQIVIRKWIDEDKTLLEIADELNISLENAKVTKHRALTFLRTAAIVKKLHSRLFSITL